MGEEDNQIILPAITKLRAAGVKRPNLSASTIAKITFGSDIADLHRLRSTAYLNRASISHHGTRPGPIESQDPVVPLAQSLGRPSAGH